MALIDYIPRSLRKAALATGLVLTLTGCPQEILDSSLFATADSQNDVYKADGHSIDTGYDTGRTGEDTTSIDSSDASIDTFIKPDTQDISQPDTFQIDSEIDTQDTEECLEKKLYYKDHDGDGKGDDNVSPKLLCKSEGEFKVLIGGDCDDTKITVYAGAPEICDGFDNECKIPQVADEPLLNVPCDNYGTTKNGLGTSTCDLGSKEYKLDSCDDPDECKTGDTKIQGTYKLFDKAKKVCTDSPLELICKLGSKEWNGKTIQANQWYENKLAGSVEGTKEDGYDNDCNGIVDDGADLMALIPAGWFERGCDAVKNFSCESNAPSKMHELSAYLIDKFEVTLAAYQVCVIAKECTEPQKLSSNKESNYYGNPQYNNHPVVNVTWQQAVDYCTFAGKKLPTEAQWERASKGKDGKNYPWGGQSPDHKHPDPNCKDDLVNWNYNTCALSPQSGSSEVGSFPKGNSPEGLSDMGGNVSEWVADWYSTNSYAGAPNKDDQGSVDGTLKVVRGGDFTDDKYARVNLTSYRRGSVDPSLNFDQTGFRCAK
ncbi:SUMF1/EgtB/PvdO family nonheme iron enzyme [Candidatus Woesearchaeota archaeon]|nr:SUMF1/EgtB/PvdO family nonheme iron enzyme [Candidatus Woesearchaeota archaeon]